MKGLTAAADRRTGKGKGRLRRGDKWDSGIRPRRFERGGHKTSNTGILRRHFLNLIDFTKLVVIRVK